MSYRLNTRKFGGFLQVGGNANNGANDGRWYGNWNNSAANGNWNIAVLRLFLVCKNTERVCSLSAWKK